MLEQAAEEIARELQRRIELPNFRPGKVSLWLKLVKLVPDDGATIEQTVGTVGRQIFLAASPAELMRDVATNVLLFVFGAELPLVNDLPNLIVKLYDKKVWIQVQGGPPLDQAGQIFVKATVYEYHPGLWEQLFGSRSKTGGEAGSN